ncbi:MAG: PAS domain S-box protein [Meiothermus sp.]|nr:PAS domain S-box protein [Meiothermus sp.]
MGIRARLAWWYGGVFTLALGLLMLVNYAVFAEEQFRSVDRQLRRSAGVLLSEWERGNPIEPRVVYSELMLIVRRYDESGRLVSGTHPQLELPPSDPAAVARKASRDSQGLVYRISRLFRPIEQAPPNATFATLNAGGERWRIYLHPVSGPQGGHLELLSPLGRLDANLAAVRRDLILAGLGVLALMMLVGWGIASRALLPVARLTLTARAIAEGNDLGRRVEASDPRDELGLLGQTLNQMLSGLEAQHKNLEARVAERTAELEASRGRAELLAALGEALQAARSPERVASTTFERLGPLLGAEYLALSWVRGESLTLGQVWGWMPGGLEAAARAGLPRGAGGMLWRVVECGEPIYAARYDEEVFRLELGLDAYAVAAEPIRDHRGQTVATLSVGRRATAEGWGWGERDLLRRAAAGLGLALERLAMLELAETQAGLAVEAANLGLWSYEVATGRVVWGGKHAALYGFPEGTREVSVEELYALVSPEDLERINRRVAQALEDGQPYELEYAVRRRDSGERRWMIARGQALQGPDGQGARVIGTLMDVTERRKELDRTLAAMEAERQARELLEASVEAERHAKAHLEAMLNHLPIGLAFFDRELRFVQVNPEIARLNGIPAAEHLGRRLEEVLHTTGPALRPRLEQVFQSGEGTYGVEVSGPSPVYGGEIGHVLASWFPVVVDGQITLVGASVLDITQRKRAEEALHESQRFLSSVTEAVPSLIYVYDLETQQNLYNNHRLFDLFGYTAGDIAALGENFISKLMHPDNLPDLERWREASRGLPDDATLEVEYRFLHKNGQWRWVRGRDRVFRRREDGRVWQMLGLLEDIHDRKLVEEREGFLLRLSDALRPLADPQEIQRAAAQLLAEHLGAARAGYAEDGGDGETVIVTHNYALGVEGIEGRHRYTDYGEDLLEALRRGETVLRPDIAADPNLADAVKAAHRALKLGATANAPLVKEGQLVAIFFVHFSGPHPWTAEEATLIGEVAERIWAAVERSRAETRLRDSEARLALALESGRMGAWDWDIPSGVQFWSPQMSEIFGVPHCDAYSAADFYRRVHPADLVRIRANAALAVERGEEYVEDEFRVVRPDGREVWVSSRARFHRDATGRVTRMTGVNLDVTERKQLGEELHKSAELLRAVMEATPDLVWAKDAEGRITLGNQATFELLGQGDPSRVLGQSAAELISDPVMAGRVQQNDQRVMATGRAEMVEEEVGVQDATRVFQTLKAPLRDGSGRVVGVVGVSRDITERRRRELEQELLAGVSDVAARQSDPAVILRDTSERIARHFGASRVILTETDEAAGRATVLHEWRSEGLPSLKGSYPLEDYVSPGALEQLRAGRVTCLSHHRDHPSPGGPERLLRLGVRAVAHAPYLDSGRLRFVLVLALPRPHAWEEGELALLRELAERVWSRLERLRAEEELRYTVELNPQVPWTADADGRILDLSPRWLELTGLNREATLGEGWFNAPHPDDLPRMQVDWRRAVESGQPYDVEHRVRLAGGGFRWMHTRAYPRRDAQGRVVRWYGTTEDIQERREAEEALARVTAQLEATLANLPLGLALLDRELRFVRINEAMARINGLAPEAHIGRRMSELALAHGIAPKTAQLAEAELRQVLESGQGVYGVEVSGPTPDDPSHERHALASWFPVQVDGQTLLVGAAVLDITQRKRVEDALRDSEERYRTLFESIDQGFCVMDMIYQDGRAVDYRFVEVNPTFAEQTGLEGAQGRTALEMVPGLERDWVERYAGVAETGQPLRFEEGSEAMGRWFEGYAMRVGRPEQRRVAVLFSDVSQRKRHEAELMRLTHDLRAVLDTVPVGIAIATDPAVAEVSMNPAGAAMLGVGLQMNASKSRPDPDALPFRVLKDGAEVPAEQLPMQLAAASGQSLRDLEYQIERADGSTLELLEYATPLFDEAGQVRGSVGVFVDITERKWVELERERLLTAVETERLLLDTLLTASPVGFALIDPELRFLRVNQALAEINGLPVEAHLGRTIDEVVPNLAPTVRPLLEEVLRTGKPLLNVELQGETAKAPGQRRDWLENVYRVVREDGVVLGVGVVLIEVTERKRYEDALRQSEQRFRWLAEATPQMVWVFDANDRLSYVNGRLLNYTGLSFEQIASGEFNLIHPEDLAGFAAAGEAARAELGVFQVEVRVQGADGEYRWFLHSAIPLQEGGRLVGWYGTSTDIHDRRLAEEALRASERRLLELVEAQKRFVADASHELRAPLTSIQGNLELLQRFRNMTREDREAALDEAAREAIRLGRLVSDLLALARGDAGTSLQLVPTDLGAVVRETLSELGPLATDKQLLAEPPPQVLVSGHRDRLKQLAIILLENALKYTPPGGVVRLEVIPDETNVVLRVSDTGIGISKEDLPHVFERFYRADLSRSKTWAFGGQDPGGTGLGLSIAKWIVEQHGGEIGLESELGRGTVVTVRLPKLLELSLVNAT